MQDFERVAMASSYIWCDSKLKKLVCGSQSTYTTGKSYMVEFLPV